jgi:hypothetical protein
MGKEKRKIKRKGISCLAGPGGFRPTWARARARARLRPGWPSSEGETAGDGAVARGPHTSEGGVNGVDDHRRRGGVDRSPADGKIPRRFSAVGPVLRRGGGGEARAGAGDHGGGVNFTGRGLWRPVRGTVAGVHGGEVAGAAVGCNRGGEVCLVTVIVWRSSSTSLI